ncbi:MAG: hypothetical protein KDK97_23270 [Verrucomicrobiales bacterium]|nr:hypothetical protein [Verrucomicrobiales bacterium]
MGATLVAGCGEKSENQAASAPTPNRPEAKGDTKVIPPLSYREIRALHPDDHKATPDDLERVLSGQCQLVDLPADTAEGVLARLRSRNDPPAMRAMAENITYSNKILPLQGNFLNGSNPCFSELLSRGDKAVPTIREVMASLAQLDTRANLYRIQLLGLCLAQIQGMDTAIATMEDVAEGLGAGDPAERVRIMKRYLESRQKAASATPQ